MPAQMAFFAQATQNPVSTNDYRVAFPVTRPSAQRKGHGSYLMRFLMAKAAKEGRGIGLACQEDSTVSIRPVGNLLTDSDCGTKAWAFDRFIIARSPRLKTRLSICGNFVGRLKQKQPRSDSSESSEELVGRGSTTAGAMVIATWNSAALTRWVTCLSPLELFPYVHMKMARSQTCLPRMV